MAPCMCVHSSTQGMSVHTCLSSLACSVFCAPAGTEVRQRSQGGVLLGVWLGIPSCVEWDCSKGVSFTCPFTCPPAHEFSKPSFHPFTHLCTHPPTKHFYIHLLSTTRSTHVLTVLCAPFNCALSTTHSSSTCLSTHLPTHLSIHPPTIYPPIHPISTHHSLIHPPIHPSTHSFIHLCNHSLATTHPLIHPTHLFMVLHPSTILCPPSTHLPIHSLTHLSIHPSTIDPLTQHPPIYLFIHPPSNHPCIHPSNHPLATTHPPNSSFYGSPCTLQPCIIHHTPTIQLPIHPPNHSSSHLSTSTIHPSNTHLPSTHPSIHPPIYLLPIYSFTPSIYPIHQCMHSPTTIFLYSCLTDSITPTAGCN